MGDKKIAILWLRNDFRFYDNLALSAASTFDELIPVFIWDECSNNPWKPGEASQWWLHQTIKIFKKRLLEAGSDLILLKGVADEQIARVAKATNASAVLFNRSYDPTDAPKVKSVIQQLERLNINFTAFQGSLLSSPEEMLKSDGSPYLVFTAFWKNFISKYNPQMVDKPKKLPNLPPNAHDLGCTLEALNLLPKLSWHEAFHDYWTPGEEEGLRSVKSFIKKKLKTYNNTRDFPEIEGTSRLSPHFHFGEIHPQRVLMLIAQEYGKLSAISDPNIVQYMKEILWREFSYNLMQHFPKTPTEPLREIFRAFPWKNNKNYLKAWTKGQTGYPIVDAGMRQLWKTGWMHNRVRMITASFLVKHLGIPWQEGAKWFWDTLVDADLASNTQGWQWTAGCGADAAPFFRIFNPIIQGEKFDPKGKYVARWCPELAKLPPKWIYRPWEAPEKEIKKAGVHLGENYPLPIVDHKEARDWALLSYEGLKSKK